MKLAVFSVMTALLTATVSLNASANTATNPESNKKAIMKDALKNLTMPQRDHMIARAQVFNTFDPAAEVGSTSTSTVDVIQDLQKRCGSAFQYRKTQNQNVYEWPVVECQYHPDDHSLGGGTSKYYCDFKEDGKTDLKKRKVKYSQNGKSVKDSELIPTILGVNSAHLLGFFTELYCPAQVICTNCPSDNPWNQDHASAPAGKGQTVFNAAMVDRELSYPQIATPQTLASKPKNPALSILGLSFNELMIVSGDTDAEIRKMRIEREAWILWINFIMETDSYSLNQRLACADPTMGADKVQCPTPIAYTHDYGHAYYERFNFGTWEQIPPLKMGSDGLCHGTLTSDIYWKERKVDYHSVLLSPVISSEARDLLVQRLSRITDKQWSDIYQLSRAEIATGVTTDRWLKAMHQKIDQLKSVNCPAFDSGNTALARP